MHPSAGGSLISGPEWVDDILLAGPPEAVCLRLPGPVGRATLLRLEKPLAEGLAGSRRPRPPHLLDQFPRTATGKLVRSPAAPRAATP